MADAPLSSLPSALEAQLRAPDRRPAPATPADAPRDALEGGRRPDPATTASERRRFSAGGSALSSEDDLQAARARVSSLSQREAPAGRLSAAAEPRIPLGQFVDIRV